MKRTELEHIIRAAGSIAEDDEILVIGSQAILAQFPEAPDELLRSLEADLMPMNKPHLSDLIDGSIGELSPFHMTFGYYAHGVSRETAILPRGWEERLIPIRNESTRGITGWCLEIHDLVVSKCAAGRERDLEFAVGAVRHGLVRQEILAARVEELLVDEETKARIRRQLLTCFSG